MKRGRAVENGVPYMGLDIVFQTGIPDNDVSSVDKRELAKEKPGSETGLS
ncbi:hypothetical protein [Phyllobacterium chamaecytisi]|nr:hypothetical protein [Phyllobacterium sp. KW56]MBZ9601592.1 hypothetical protein [Phyllobacterium sp. KW56]